MVIIFISSPLDPIFIFLPHKLELGRSHRPFCLCCYSSRAALPQICVHLKCTLSLLGTWRG